jgi:hypothetical protein
MEHRDVLAEAGMVVTAATGVALCEALDRYETARRDWQRALWHAPRTSPAYWTAQRMVHDALANLTACWALHTGGAATAP